MIHIPMIALAALGGFLLRGRRSSGTTSSGTLESTILTPPPQAPSSTSPTYTPPTPYTSTPTPSGGAGTQTLPTSLPGAAPGGAGLPAGLTPQAVAQALHDYYQRGGRDHAVISAAQAALGGGIAVDGDVGPHTRQRARDLGVSWPDPTSTPSSSSSSTETATGTPGVQPSDAAALLHTYYSQGGRDVQVIKQAQRAMSGGLVVDGIVGQHTRQRARDLGQNWPEPGTTTTTHTEPGGFSGTGTQQA